MAAKSFTIQELADRLGGSVEGDAGVVVTGIAPLEQASAGELTFVYEARHAGRLSSTKAAAALIGKDCPLSPLPAIRVANVPAAVAAVLNLIGEDEFLPAPGIHPTAVIDPSAKIGVGVAVGPGAVVGPEAVIAAGAILCANVVVGPQVQVGENTVLFEGTVIYRRCHIGRACRIGPSAVIGSTGFGYYHDQAGHHRVPHTGAVLIEDEVEIGACSCVDRGKFGDTVIGQGTKIDNLVQIAHNVRIGKRCLLAALVGVAGSTVLKDYVVLGGHVGVRDNITVGNGVQVAACSAIAQDVEDAKVLSGIPTIDARNWLRSVHLFARLPELAAQVKQLEKKVQELESAKNH